MNPNQLYWTIRGNEDCSNIQMNKMTNCNNANNINSEEHGHHEIPEMTNHAQQKHLQQCDAVAHDYQGNT